MGPARGRLRAWLVRLRSFLGGRDWVYLLALLVPLVVYNLTLKAIRIQVDRHLDSGEFKSPNEIYDPGARGS
jgi:hypothetical protein